MEKRNNGNAPDLAEFVPALSHKRQWLHFWNTPEAFAAHCEKTPENWHGSAWKQEGEGQFHGTRNLQEAVTLCRDGWKEGADRASKLRDRINAANPTGPRVIRYDVAGAYPSVPRALAGNPLNMRRVDTARLRRRPVMTLLSDAGVNCMVDVKSQERRAAVVAAVVDAIEASGFACQIITTAAVQSEPGPTKDAGKLSGTVATQIKESAQPVDIGRIAFALGHPAYLRRLCFVAFTENEYTRDLRSNIGYPRAVDVSPEMNARGVYLLPSCDGAAEAHFRTDDAAATAGLKFIIDALAKQGCPAFATQEANAA